MEPLEDQETRNRERELHVDSVAFFGLSEIAEQLGKIHNSLRSFNVNACDGEVTFNVKAELTAGTDEDACTVWIKCDALDRMANAFERIADAVIAKGKSE